MKTAIKIVIAILLGCTTAFSNAQNIEENARVKIKKLKEMVESAQKRGIYTEREQMTLRTAGLFLTWANWDEAHVDKNEAYYKSLPYFEPKADSLAKVLPNYERSEVNAILDDAIERLSKVLDGTYTRKSVPKVDYSKARLKNNVILANGRPRITSYNVCYTKLLRQRMVDAIRGTGCEKPIFYNVSHNIEPQSVSTTSSFRCYRSSASR